VLHAYMDPRVCVYVGEGIMWDVYMYNKHYSTNIIGQYRKSK